MTAEKKIVGGQEITRKQFLLLKAAMAAGGEQAFESLKGLEEPEPSAPRYSPTSLPQEVDEAELRKALSYVRFAYSEAWFDTVRFEIDFSFVPNRETVRAELSWEGRDAVPTRLDSDQGVLSFELPCGKDHVDELLRSLHGHLTLSAAGAFDRIVFTSSEVGTEKSGYLLRELAGNRVAIQLPDGAPHGIIAALDASGHRLAWNSTGQDTFHKDGRKLWDLDWDELKDEDLVATYQAAFCGRVAQVQIHVPRSRVEIRNPVVVVPERKPEGEVVGTRFRPIEKSRFRDLSAEEVRSGVSIQVRTDPDPVVEVRLPDVDNSAYADVVVKVERAVDDRKQVVNDVKFSLTRYSDRCEFHLSEPNPELRRIVAQVEILYPRKVETVSPPRDGVRVTLKGPEIGVSWDPSEFPLLEEMFSSLKSPALQPLLAYHESGYLLVRLPSTSYQSRNSETTVKTAFWGDVHRVELRIPAECVSIRRTIEMEIP